MEIHTKGQRRTMTVETVLYVADYRTGRSDDEAIRLCMEERKKAAAARVVFSGADYRITRSVLLPSNTTAVIDGCTVKLADGAFDTLFRGDNLVLDEADPYGYPLEILPIENVRILGRNGGKIEGCDVNPRILNYVKGVEEEVFGDFWGWRTLNISLSRCDGFEVAGLTMEKSRCWTMSFDMCRNGYIHDIVVNSNVKNGDCIDFRSGCHDCRVENITGYTGDDTVACTALRAGRGKVPAPSGVYPGEYYLYPMEPTGFYDNRSGEDRNISRIRIRNLETGGKHHGVICLAANGCKVHDVTVENVREVPMDGPDSWRQATVKIYTGYGSGYTRGDIHDITVSDIRTTYAQYSVFCNAEVENVLLRNITAENDAPMRLDFPQGITIE